MARAIEPDEPYRVGCLIRQPIQYAAPLFRYLSRDPSIDLTVLFMSDFSTHAYREPTFGINLKWDVPLVEGYRHIFLPAYGSTDSYSFWRPFSRKLGQYLQRNRIEALWVHGYAQQTLLRAIGYAKLRGIKVLLRGESHLGLQPRTASSFLRQHIKRYLFSLADGFLAIGTLNRDYYLEYGVLPKRIFMAPYAVDNDFFRMRAERARPHRDQLRRELNLEAGRFVILYASKMMHEKAPLDLLEAYARLLSSGRDAACPYLLFVGDGELREALEARARQLDGNSVRFLGFRNQTELPRYYDLCDVFVLPSVYEPWGLVVNEVMNAGKPVIVSDKVGAHADLVKEGENGFVVAAGDVALLAQKLKVLTENAELAAAMGKRSLEIISGWNFEADRHGLLEALATVTGRTPALHSRTMDEKCRSLWPNQITTSSS
jgi:glycosyltransferase involved in cell wall biosynthesis